MTSGVATLHERDRLLVRRARESISRATERWCRPTPALPVDIFRVLVGVLSSVYFFHLYTQVGDFSSPDGLIDHDLTRQLFWYTRIGLFQPGMSTAAFQIIFLVASAASWALVIGYRVKAIAAGLFVVAVSAYRWNFLVIYVDDAIMHLVLFWLLLLPIGRTLVLSEWLRDRDDALKRWKAELVPGGPVRCFLVNLALVYLVAGLWKWTSPMWRDGTALYAALRMPISYTPDLWRPEHLPMLRIANYGAMVLEPVMPLMLVLPTNHRLKWALFGGCIGFHVGIVATMMMPYANLACVAAAAIVFRHEIMRWLGGADPSSYAAHGIPESRWCTRTSVAFVSLLTLAMAAEVRVPSWRYPSRESPAEVVHSSRVPTARVSLARLENSSRTTDGRVGFLRSEHNVFYSPLWFIGIAQSYRLFDWIDDRNFHARYEVIERSANGVLRRIDSRELFPASLRAVLLESYLNDVTWGRIPTTRAAEFKAGLFTRFAARFCRRHSLTGEVAVHAQVERIRTDHAVIGSEPQLLMLFACNNGMPSVHYPHGDDPSKLALERGAY